MAQIEVIRGIERYRRWSLEEKEGHVARAFAPGVKVKTYARQTDIATSSLYEWRKELRHEVSDKSGFVSVVAQAEQKTLASGLSVIAHESAIELEVRGDKVRIPCNIPPSLAGAVIQALVQR